MSLQCNLPQIDPVKTVSIKSKYGAEFRRFAIQPSDQAKNLANNSSVNSSTNNSPLTNSNHNNSNNLDNSINPLHSTSTSSLQSAQKLLRLAGITFQEFEATLAKLHKLDNECSPIDQSYTFKIFYTDPKTSTLLPINNDDNLARAIASSQFHSCQKNNNSSFLRIYIYNSANQPNINNNSVHNQSTDSHNDSDTSLPGNISGVTLRRGLAIGSPINFRPVSAIIDVDILPESLRRVRIHKHKSDKPLGFYIRDGTAVRTGVNGLEKVPSCFISRLIPDGLAHMTGLLQVNDEVLEVNGIDIRDKTLDQVTDMMIANSENLIVTVKPANQANNPIRKSQIGQESAIVGRGVQSNKINSASGITQIRRQAINNSSIREMDEAEDEDQVREFMPINDPETSILSI